MAMAAIMVELAELEEKLKTRMHYPNVTDLKLIYDKTLTDSDVNKNQSRLAMSRNKVLTPFLTHYEDLYLQWKTKDGSNTTIPLDVVVGSTAYKLTLSRWDYYDPYNNKHTKQDIIIDDSNAKNNTTTTGNTNNTTTGNTDGNLSNKKRKRTHKNKQDNDDDAENKKKSYRWKYVLKGGWNQLKVDNHLQSGDRIRVVSFRSHNNYIGFVLLPAPSN